MGKHTSVQPRNTAMFGTGGILPRAEKQSTGLFFAAVAAALFESRRSNTIPKKKADAKKRPLSFLVGVAGFEPTASWTRTKRDTKLRHTPER